MTKPKILPVIDNKNLVRDVQSKALLSTNKSLLEEHRQKKAFLKSLYEQNMEVHKLKEEMSEIKMLLKELVNNHKY